MKSSIFVWKCQPVKGTSHSAILEIPFLSVGRSGFLLSRITPTGTPKNVYKKATLHWGFFSLLVHAMCEDQRIPTKKCIMLWQ